MPKVAKSDPEALRPFLCHGVDLSWRDGDADAVGECPFCGKDRKFNVNLATSKFQCFPCKVGGNSLTFIRKLWEMAQRTTKDCSDLLADRKLLYDTTLKEWGVARSPITGYWLLPGFGIGGKLDQLYRYQKTMAGMRLLPTTMFNHQLFGMNLFDKSKRIIYLCEGPWDAMALWEVLGLAKKSDSDVVLIKTANYDLTILAKSNVLAVPGCTTFSESWCPIFAGCTVNLMYDNDHPRKHPKTGQDVLPAGYEGMQRTAKILSSSTDPPEQINFLRWSPEGHSHNADLKSGYDVRDKLSIGTMTNA